MGKILKVVGLVILAIVATIVIYFMVDDVPSAKAKHYLELFEVEEIDSLDNGYYYMKDFDFHSSDDLVEIVKKDSTTYMYSTTFDKMDTLMIRSDHDDYLDKVKTHSSYIDRLWERYSLVDSIFENVCRAPKFDSRVEGDSDFISSLQHFLVLKNNHLALEYMRGNNDDAIKRISENLKDLRLHCKNVDTGLYKSGSAVYLERDLYLMNNLLDYSGNRDDELFNLIENLELLTLEERDYTNVARSDFYGLIHPEIEVEDYWARIFYPRLKVKDSWPIVFYPKKNRVMNSMWFYYEKGIDLSKTEPNNFTNVRKREKSKQSRLPGRILWDYLFEINLFSAYYDRIKEFHEVNGYIQLLKLKVEIFKEEVPIDLIPDYLLNNKERYNNPFNLDALKWNKETREIYYECPGDEYLLDEDQYELKIRKIQIKAR